MHAACAADADIEGTSDAVVAGVLKAGGASASGADAAPSARIAIITSRRVGSDIHADREVRLTGHLSVITAVGGADVAIVTGLGRGVITGADVAAGVDGAGVVVVTGAILAWHALANECLLFARTDSVIVELTSHDDAAVGDHSTVSGLFAACFVYLWAG